MRIGVPGLEREELLSFEPDDLYTEEELAGLPPEARRLLLEIKIWLVPENEASDPQDR
jgi:hypothetical protein